MVVVQETIILEVTSNVQGNDNTPVSWKYRFLAWSESIIVYSISAQTFARKSDLSTRSHGIVVAAIILAWLFKEEASPALQWNLRKKELC